MAMISQADRVNIRDELIFGDPNQVAVHLLKESCSTVPDRLDAGMRHVLGLDIVRTKNFRILALCVKGTPPSPPY